MKSTLKNTLFIGLVAVGLCAAYLSTPDATAVPDPQAQSPIPITLTPFTKDVLTTPYTLGSQRTNTLTFQRGLVIDTLPGQVPLITLRGLNKSTNAAATKVMLSWRVATVADATTLSDTNLYQTREILQEFTLSDTGKLNQAQSITTVTNSRQLILYKVGINSAIGESNALGQSFTISNLTATVWK